MIQLTLFGKLPAQGSAPAYWPYSIPRAYPGKQLIRVYGMTVKEVPCMFDLATNYVIPDKAQAADLPWDM